MKVFISWSGNRSKHIAAALKPWLKKVLQTIDPWMSSEDIDSGARWSKEISGNLEACDFGIICVTPENQSAPWIMFEAGALSKSLDKSHVCPYLYDLTTSGITGPISQFQARVSNKEGTFKIVESLYKALEEKPISEEELKESFDVWWPKLERELKNCPEYDGEKIEHRPQNEILNELVENSRELIRVNGEQKTDMKLLTSLFSKLLSGNNTKLSNMLGNMQLGQSGSFLYKDGKRRYVFNPGDSISKDLTINDFYNKGVSFKVSENKNGQTIIEELPDMDDS